MGSWLRAVWERRRVPGAVSLAVLLSGCYSVSVVPSTATEADVVAHVLIGNYGWRLFGCVPLVCGNANANGFGPWAFFRDDLKPELAHAKLQEKMAEADAEARDIRLFTDDFVLFDVYYAVVPWVITYKEISLSANLVKKGGAK